MGGPPNAAERFFAPHNFFIKRRSQLRHKPKIRGGAFPARGVWGAKRPHKIRSTAFRGGAAEKT